MEEEQNLHEEVTDEMRQREVYSKISRTILNMEIENTRNFKRFSDKEMANKIVKLIEREVK